MDVKNDIQYLQLLLDCAFGDDHPSHQCLKNIVHAIDSPSRLTTSFRDIPSGWRDVLMSATEQQLNDRHWVTSFFSEALPLPCIFSSELSPFGDDTVYRIECKIPFERNLCLSRNVSFHAMRGLESTAYFRKTIAEMLTDIEIELKKRRYR